MNRFIQLHSHVVFLKAMLGMLILLFGFSLFQHISYPLLWNDESYGAVNALSILKYGYPKVHDEKGNMVLEPPQGYPVKDCYNSKYDIPTYISWGNEYFAAIGVYLAKYTNDIYLKTALVRIPFAVAGLAGLIVLMLAVRKLFSSRTHYWMAMIAFMALELLSVPLILHMREARYYSILILLQSCFIWLNLDHLIFKKLNPAIHIVVLTLIFFAAYQFNFLFFLIFCSAWLLNLIFSLAVTSDLKVTRPDRSWIGPLITGCIPVAFSLVLILPFELLLYKTYLTSINLSRMWSFSFQSYLKNLFRCLRYFFNYEWLGLGFLFKLIFYGLYFFRKQMDEKLRDEYCRYLRAGLLLNFYWVFALAAISRNPDLFLRYIIPLQPVLAFVFAMEGLFVVRWIVSFNFLLSHSFKYLLLAAMGILGMIHFSLQLPWIKGHWHEITNQYKGPLDYVIPYIQKHYSKPETLCIATNYETTSYIYYLNARLLVGYIPLQLEIDSQYEPDIIVFRKIWNTSPDVFKAYLKRSKYKAVRFPVLDSAVNNIPELYFWGDSLHHQFSTRLTDQSLFQVVLFAKEN